MPDKKKKKSITQKLAEKSKKRRQQGKQTSSKDLPPGRAKDAAKAIEARKRKMQKILKSI